MKKVLLVAAMMLSSAAMFAQHAVGSFTLQPKAGVSIANLTNVDDSDPRWGLTAGAELEYQATDIFSVSVGALYSIQGCKPGEGTTIKADYINVPILANVYVAKGFAVKFGVQPGFNVNSEWKMKGHGISASADLDAKSVDFSFPVGLSYEFASLPVVVDARYNWGVTKVFDTPDDTPKNSVFQVTVGYKFEL